MIYTTQFCRKFYRHRIRTRVELVPVHSTNHSATVTWYTGISFFVATRFISEWFVSHPGMALNILGKFYIKLYFKVLKVRRFLKFYSNIIWLKIDKHLRTCKTYSEDVLFCSEFIFELNELCLNNYVPFDITTKRKITKRVWRVMLSTWMHFRMISLN